jgi:hypothetical protein
MASRHLNYLWDIGHLRNGVYTISRQFGAPLRLLCFPSLGLYDAMATA